MTLCRMDQSPDKVYLKHRGLIRSLINSIVVNNPAIVDTQDLQQAGALALVVALKSYDPSLGSLPSYIRKCIRHALLEQANSFSNVFTVDEKVRRQANAVRRMRREGIDDAEIMAKLGIKTRATFLSLLGLVENHSVDPNQIEVVDDTSPEEGSIFKVLDEIGLTEQELKFVNLVTSNYSMDDIVTEMAVSRSTLFVIKASIRDKILAWGQDS